MLCGTVVLDGPDDISARVANDIYNRCRAKTLSIPQFPEFNPILEGLKNGETSVNPRQYNVSVPVGDNLVILESFAAKFVESEVTKEQATVAIQDHNQKYNPNCDYWKSAERRMFLYNTKNLEFSIWFSPHRTLFMACRTDKETVEPPAKRLRLSQDEHVKESDVSSLESPSSNLL